jgi:hypothetical protein
MMASRTLIIAAAAAAIAAAAPARPSGRPEPLLDLTARVIARPGRSGALLFTD